MTFFYVGVGGFLGSCLRYLFNLAFHDAGIPLPLGTLVSNVTAGLLIGFIMGMDRQTGMFASDLRLFLTTGFLGGLSTFSAFSLETVDLFEQGRYVLCLGNVLSNLVFSILGVVLGMGLAKVIFAKA